jgi:hypothetical protein
MLDSKEKIISLGEIIRKASRQTYSQEDIHFVNRTTMWGIN